MNNHGWKHFKQLQDITRSGYNNLLTKRKIADNSLLEEIVSDLFQIGIGLSIYIHLDIRPFLPLTLPDAIQNGSLGPIVAAIGLALAGYGGVRLLASLIESATWIISSAFQKKYDD